MNLLHLLGIVIYATDVIVSPIPDEPKPLKTFAQITNIHFPSVLGIEIENEKTAQLENSFLKQTPSITPTPTISQYKLWKNPVKIALLGDSMIDTLGEHAPEIKTSIQKYYPNLGINIMNYGVGATNIDYGIQRITNSYEYLGKSIPSLASQQPDIVIIESFGYNPYPFDNGAIDTHWLALARCVDTIKQSIPHARIVISATIAPNADTFGDGAPGISFTKEEKQKRVNIIKQYLESTVRFAKSQNLPLANAYHPSLQSDGNGNLLYINKNDNIHPSENGRQLFADILAKTLVEHKLLEL